RRSAHGGGARPPPTPPAAGGGGGGGGRPPSFSTPWRHTTTRGWHARPRRPCSTTRTNSTRSPRRGRSPNRRRARTRREPLVGRRGLLRPAQGAHARRDPRALHGAGRRGRRARARRGGPGRGAVRRNRRVPRDPGRSVGNARNLGVLPRHGRRRDERRRADRGRLGDRARDRGARDGRTPVTGADRRNRRRARRRGTG